MWKGLIQEIAHTDFCAACFFPLAELESEVDLIDTPAVHIGSPDLHVTCFIWTLSQGTCRIIWE
jgi:hypothetical protein